MAVADSSTFRIVVLPGDHAGPEVIAEAVKVLRALESVASVKFDLQYHDFGGASIDKHGVPLTDETLEACKNADAILLGAIGGPEWTGGKVRPEQGLLALRKSLNVWANVRPCVFPSESVLALGPLREDVARGTEFIVLRELVGGVYFGDRKEAGDDGKALDTMPYSEAEIERVAHMAAFLAKQHPKPEMRAVHSIDKANVLATSRLWRKVFTRVFAESYPDIPLEHQLVDSAAMKMVKNPTSLNGVVATENLFGDILSDEASVIPGSLGLLPSASLGDIPREGQRTNGLYEPIHGSAPDIAGKGICNPIGTILSVALMLRWSFNLPELAERVEQAVRHAIDSTELGGAGFYTADMGGDKSTSEMGDAIVAHLTEQPPAKKQKVSA